MGRGRRNNAVSRAATVLGHELLSLALVLAFLHVDPEAYLGLGGHPVADSGRSPLHPGPEKVVSELSNLGRYNGNVYDPVEISAYVFTNGVASSSDPGHNLARVVDDDSGVSDVDSAPGVHYDEDNLSSASTGPATDDIDDDANTNDLPDWLFETADHGLSGAQSPVVNEDYRGLFDTNESNSIFRDLDELIGGLGEPHDDQDMVLAPAESLPGLDSSSDNLDVDFSPDAEDVENQLMHIDDQLIRIDVNLEDITDHLVDEEALLTQEEENYLFASMPEVINPWPRMDNEPEVEKCNNSAVKEDVIKEEPADEEDYLSRWFEPIDESSPSVAGSSDEEKTTVDECTDNALSDHNYALSAFDECFGPPGKPCAPDIEFVGGASALSPADSAVATTRPRESRDEKKARHLALPFAVSDIVDLPIDAFNDLISRYTLNVDQVALCRDIRRRGKNKVAAQNCRKRKMDLISHLEGEVSRARHRKQVLLAEREELFRLRNEWSDKLMNLEAAVLRGLNRNVDDFALDLSGSTVRVTSRLGKPTKA